MKLKIAFLLPKTDRIARRINIVRCFFYLLRAAFRRISAIEKRGTGYVIYPDIPSLKVMLFILCLDNSIAKHRDGKSFMKS